MSSYLSVIRLPLCRKYNNLSTYVTSMAGDLCAAITTIKFIYICPCNGNSYAGNTIDDLHNMWVLLAACHELVAEYNTLPELLCVLNITLIILISPSPYTVITVIGSTYILQMCFVLIIQSMMTSSNGNIFRVTGPLNSLWIPLTKASDAELWCFLCCTPEQTAE